MCHRVLQVHLHPVTLKASLKWVWGTHWWVELSALAKAREKNTVWCLAPVPGRQHCPVSIVSCATHLFIITSSMSLRLPFHKLCLYYDQGLTRDWWLVLEVLSAQWGRQISKEKKMSPGPVAQLGRAPPWYTLKLPMFQVWSLVRAHTRINQWMNK